MLQASYERATKDSDIFETTSLTKDIQTKLLALAGKSSALCMRRRIYIDIVANGIPFLPTMPLWHPVAFSSNLSKFELRVLDIVDVVVSKLKRFSANDLSDIDAMIGRGLVPHVRLVERFTSAFREFSHDARAAELLHYVEHLHQVERDLLGVAESEFDVESLRY